MAEEMRAGAAMADTLAAMLETRDGGARPLAEVPAAVQTGADRFALGAEIGAGGMGRVVSATDRQFGRGVALKLLSPELTSTEGLRRFLVEAVVTGNLEHPGIPAVYERGVTDGTPFYAMRHVEGRTLTAAVEAAHTTRQRLALLPAVVQVAQTLGFAHERGVVHRDVKPDNVIVGEHGEVVLLDWGIARVRGAELPEVQLAGETAGEAQQTAAGAVLGTPAYMAPEQASGKVEAIDERTDVFALGALLYHVLSGRPPFEGPTAVSALSRALESRPEPLSRLAPEVPQLLREIVEHAMAPDRQARFSNAQEVAEALEAFVAGSLAAAPSKWLRMLVAGISTLTLLTMAAGAAIAFVIGPALVDQGPMGYGLVGCAIAGTALGLIEWGTRGRHDLAPLAAALAACTLLIGIAATSGGVANLAAYVAQANLEAAALEVFFTEIPLALGPIALGSILAGFQVVLLALARRAAR